MLDQSQPDDKIIAVAAQDMSVAHLDDIAALPAHMLLELRGFFEDYKRLEQKTVVVDQFQGPLAARAIVQASITSYQNTFRDRLP
jgi:inorganic pyrophosphatase